MKVKDLLKVVDKYYLSEVRIYVGDYEDIADYEDITAWAGWDSVIIQKYYDRKIMQFTWFENDLWICVED